MLRSLPCLMQAALWRRALLAVGGEDAEDAWQAFLDIIARMKPPPPAAAVGKRGLYTFQFKAPRDVLKPFQLLGVDGPRAVPVDAQRRLLRGVLERWDAATTSTSGDRASYKAPTFGEWQATCEALLVPVPAAGYLVATAPPPPPALPPPPQQQELGVAATVDAPAGAATADAAAVGEGAGAGVAASAGAQRAIARWHNILGHTFLSVPTEDQRQVADACFRNTESRDIIGGLREGVSHLRNCACGTLTMCVLRLTVNGGCVLCLTRCACLVACVPTPPCLSVTRAQAVDPLSTWGRLAVCSIRGSGRVRRYAAPSPCDAWLAALAGGLYNRAHLCHMLSCIMVIPVVGANAADACYSCAQVIAFGGMLVQARVLATTPLDTIPAVTIFPAFHYDKLFRDAMEFAYENVSRCVA